MPAMFPEGQGAGCQAELPGRQRPARPLAAGPSARRPRHARGRRARLHAGDAGQASRVSGMAGAGVHGLGWFVSSLQPLAVTLPRSERSFFFPAPRPDSLPAACPSRGSSRPTHGGPRPPFNSICKLQVLCFQFRHAAGPAAMAAAEAAPEDAAPDGPTPSGAPRCARDGTSTPGFPVLRRPREWSARPERVSRMAFKRVLARSEPSRCSTRFAPVGLRPRRAMAFSPP